MVFLSAMSGWSFSLDQPQFEYRHLKLNLAGIPARRI